MKILKAAIKVSLAAMFFLYMSCGKTGREQCYDDCTSRAILCHNVLEGDFSEKFLLCGQEICYRSCDDRARAVTAEQRERDERNRK